jgi:hypothetical protein
VPRHADLPVPDLFREVGPVWVVRLVMDLGQGEVVERRQIPLGRAADFPAIDPRQACQPTESVWLLAISTTGWPPGEERTPTSAYRAVVSRQTGRVRRPDTCVGL